jgi:hypothetical protein
VARRIGQIGPNIFPGEDAKTQGVWQHGGNMKARYEPKDFLTVREAAKIIGRAPGSIYSRIESGSFKATIVDGRVMVRTIDACCLADELMLAEIRSWGVLEVDMTPP